MTVQPSNKHTVNRLSLDVLLLSAGLQIWLHHLHKVFGGLVSVTRHVYHGERLPHFEEVHLLRVPLGDDKRIKTNSPDTRYTVRVLPDVQLTHY